MNTFLKKAIVTSGVSASFLLLLGSSSVVIAETITHDHRTTKVPRSTSTRELSSVFPIVLKESDQRSPPVLGMNYNLIGYWDVDDHKGNKKNHSLSPKFPKVPKAPKTPKIPTLQDLPQLKDLSPSGLLPKGAGKCSQGTFTPITRHGGCYTASLGVDRNNLHKITDLRITASNKPTGKILKRYPFKSGTVHHPDRSKRRYLVGIWDVDGGGGYGNDGSVGKYGMSLEAEFRNTKSQRKLLDLVLVASNKKRPKMRKGYDIIGYWDVDRGGSRGTNGSTGTYMMTLLAKWSK